MLYIIHKYKITVHALERIAHDGGVKEREQRVAGRRDINGPLSFPSLLCYTLHKPQRCHSPTHPTAATTQPSGAFWIEPLWFALSYCMRHKRMEDYSRVIVLLGFVFRTKRCFPAGVGRTPA